MSRFHGTLFHAYGLAVKQLPLPPRHAFNASDRLLARLNAYFERLMRVCFLVGAKQFADCLAGGIGSAGPGALAGGEQDAALASRSLVQLHSG